VIDLRDNGIDVWLDSWKVLPGQSIRQRIEEGIGEYRFFGIVLTLRSVSSQWVQKELDAAFGKELQQSKTVVLPLRREACDIPLLLQGKKYIDFTSSRAYQKGLSELIALLRKPEPDTSSLSRYSTHLMIDEDTIAALQDLLDVGHVNFQQEQLLFNRLTMYGESIIPLLEEKCRKFNWDRFDWDKHASINIWPRLLGHFRSPTSVDVLGTVLASSSATGWRFRSAAALALGNIGTLAATEMLISASRCCDDGTRCSIAAALSNVREGKHLAIERLIEFLSDPDDGVRRSAVVSLETLAPSEQIKNAVAKYRENELLLGSLEIGGNLFPGCRIEYASNMILLYKPEDRYAGTVATKSVPHFVDGMIYWEDAKCGGWGRELLFQVDYHVLYKFFDIDEDKWSELDRWKWQIVYDLVGLRKDRFADIHSSIKSVSVGFYHEQVDDTDLYINRQIDCPYMLSMRWPKSSIHVDTANEISTSIDSVFFKLHEEYLACLDLHKRSPCDQPSWIRAQACRLRAHQTDTEYSGLDYAKMERLYNAALQHEPKSGYTMFELAAIQRSLGCETKAVRTLTRLVKVDPKGYPWLNH
jgi:hypothetical protein